MLSEKKGTTITTALSHTCMAESRHPELAADNRLKRLQWENSAAALRRWVVQHRYCESTLESTEHVIQRAVKQTRMQGWEVLQT